VKVLEKGNWDEPWCMKVRCQKCAALLEIGLEDLKDGNPLSGNVRSSPYLHVSCPECSNPVIVLKGDVPERIACKVPPKKYFSGRD